MDTGKRFKAPKKRRLSVESEMYEEESSQYIQHSTLGELCICMSYQDLGITFCADFSPGMERGKRGWLQVHAIQTEISPGIEGGKRRGFKVHQRFPITCYISDRDFPWNVGWEERRAISAMYYISGNMKNATYEVGQYHKVYSYCKTISCTLKQHVLNFLHEMLH